MFDEFLVPRGQGAREPFTRRRLPRLRRRQAAPTACARSSPRGASTLPEGRPRTDPARSTVRAWATARTRRSSEGPASDGIDPYPGSVRPRPRRVRGTRRRRSSSRNATQCSRWPASPIASTSSSTARGGRPQSPASRRPTRSWTPPGASASAPARAVVIEDAISGVAAGRAGGFGLVVGVDREPATTPSSTVPTSSSTTSTSCCPPRTCRP